MHTTNCGNAPAISILRTLSREARKQRKPLDSHILKSNLEAYTHHDGRTIAPCVIREVSNEAYRRLRRPKTGPSGLTYQQRLKLTRAARNGAGRYDLHDQHEMARDMRFGFGIDMGYALAILGSIFSRRRLPWLR